MNKVTVKGLRKSPFSSPSHPIRHHVSCASRKRDSQAGGRETQHLVDLELDFFSDANSHGFIRTNPISHIGYRDRIVKLNRNFPRDVLRAREKVNYGFDPPIPANCVFRIAEADAAELESAENAMSERCKLLDTTRPFSTLLLLLRAELALPLDRNISTSRPMISEPASQLPSHVTSINRKRVGRDDWSKLI